MKYFGKSRLPGSGDLIKNKMDCQLSILTSGCNGSGHAALVSIDKTIRSERRIFNRIFLNVGDSTQRFCQEHRIKLSSISTIIITSLSPHNISGFPGVFLSLSDLVIALQLAEMWLVLIPLGFRALANLQYMVL